MAYATADALIVSGPGDRRPIASVSAELLQAYASDRIAAAIAYPKDRLVRRDFRLARLNMTAWFASEKLADLCGRTLSLREDEDTSATHAEVLALDAEADGWDMPAAWDMQSPFSSREFERILAADNKRGFYHHEGPSWQFYDPARAVGMQTLPTELGIPPWETGSPLRLFLHWAYAADDDMRLTHAATLGLNGRGALIAGASGSGKSGTTLAGLLNGLNSAGDDYVLVEQGSRIVAHSVFTVFKLDTDGLSRTGMERADFGDTRLNWHGKIEFNAAKFRPRAFTDRMEISALLIPEIAGSRNTVIERASMHEAALALTPSAVLQLPGDAEKGFRFFSGLARRLPAFRVRLSKDPVEIAAAIGSFLAREQDDSG